MQDTFNVFSRRIYNFVSSPIALMLAFSSIVLWAASGPHYRYSADWLMIVNSGGTIITFLMVFVLNNAQSRDTAAINAKLDALILAVEGADNRVVGVEAKTVEETRAVREQIANAVADADASAAQAQASAADAKAAAGQAETSAGEAETSAGEAETSAGDAESSADGAEADRERGETEADRERAGTEAGR